ncbi:hypothetical protein [Peribacillus loiseleuriae]|nr:hypothetical protein [Peribacillus loiseleuriae]
MEKESRKTNNTDNSGTKYHEDKAGHIPGYGLVDENAKLLLDEEESK